MKYVFRFNEQTDSDQYLTLASAQPSQTERDSIIAEIEAAEQIDDWQTVRELTQKLKGLHESLMLGWQEYGALLESVQEGKSVLQEIADREVAKMLERNLEPGATPESRAEMEARIRERVTEKYFGPDSDFEKIKFLLRKEPKYVPAFVRFRYNQGATYDSLKILYKMLVDLRDSLGQLPMSVDQYSSLVYSPGDTPGWEKLSEELGVILELRKGNWIVKALPKEAMKDLIDRGLWQGQPVNLRDAYEKAPREKQLELLRVAADLEKLNKPNFKELIRRGLSGKPTLDSIIEAIKSTAANANTDRGEILERALAAYPSVAVLYNGENHYVFSFRNDSQLPHLCAKATSWCIQPAWYNKGMADRFWNYASGSLQLGILDFTVDPSSPFHTVGATINPNRAVTSLCDQPNRCTNGSDFRQMFTGFTTSNGNHSYPQELIDAIDENFDNEVRLKASTDDVYKKIKKYSEGERDYDKVLIKTIEGMVRDITDIVKDNDFSIEDGKVSSEKNIANQIIAAELKNLRNSPELARAQTDMLRDYTTSKKALATPADVKMFELFFEGSNLLTPDKIKILLSKSRAYEERLGEQVQKIPSDVNSPTAKKVRTIYKNIIDAGTSLEALIEKIKNKG